MQKNSNDLNMKNERRSERQTNRERKKTIAAYINRTKSMYWSSSIVRLVHWREIIGTCYMDDKSKSNQIWSTVDRNKQQQKNRFTLFSISLRWHPTDMIGMFITELFQLERNFCVFLHFFNLQIVLRSVWIFPLQLLTFSR